MWRICQAYHVDMKEVMAVNKITDATKIEKGQKIFIPRANQFVQVRPTTRWTHIVVHHSATFAGNAEIFDKQHHQRGFWNGLGYHFVIDNGTNGRRDGQVEVGHRWTRQMDGAHCNAMNMNKVGIGICLVGNFDEDQPSQAQFQALTSLVSQLKRQFGVPEENILRHNMVTGKATDCPGLRFPWQTFKQQVVVATNQPSSAETVATVATNQKPAA
ncbi:MAG: N-acetylmuramoyl-L-alanine amidase [Candidatus Omnitrophica bacterium]|nr:N-acetylmuramoyl-L-alanine amidase [Candidatus Omnitrophota bacterium]